jgi:hypothetical protein
MSTTATTDDLGNTAIEASAEPTGSAPAQVEEIHSKEPVARSRKESCQWDASELDQWIDDEWNMETIYNPSFNAILRSLRSIDLIAEREFLDEDKVAEYWENMISVKMKRLEMSASIELSKRCRADIDLGVVESSEAAIQPIYAASIIEGRLRLICPEVEDGLILQDLTRSTAEEGCFVWFSLGDKANGKPFMEDLEQPHFFEGQPFRIPIKADASQSKYGKAFVTAML